MLINELIPNPILKGIVQSHVYNIIKLMIIQLIKLNNNTLLIILFLFIFSRIQEIKNTANNTLK